MFESIPERLRAKMSPLSNVPDIPDILPENSVVFLYDGEADDKSMRATYLKKWPQETNVFAFDIKQCSTHDMLGKLYDTLVTSAILGRITAVTAGPNCKSWTVLLQRIKHGFPAQKRSRQDPWESIQQSRSATHQLDAESLLILRFVLVVSFRNSFVRRFCF